MLIYLLLLIVYLMDYLSGLSLYEESEQSLYYKM